MPPVKHTCNQVEDVSKLKWLLDPDTWFVMVELKTLKETTQNIEKKLDLFIEWADKKFITRVEFDTLTKTFALIAVILWIASTIIAFTK